MPLSSGLVDVRRRRLNLDSEMERIGSGGNDTFDEWLKICWRKQECGSCLGTRGVVCSWCPAVCFPFFHSVVFASPC